MFLTSIKVSFFFNDINGSLELISFEIRIIIMISFLFDMIANINTGFYEKGVLNLNRSEIVRNYIKGSLFTDILVQLPIIVAIFVTEDSDYTI